MIKKILRRVSGAACVAALSGSAQGAALFLEPVAQFIDLGAGYTLDVNISGLGAGSAPSISSYDIDLFYDPVVLAPASVVFGDPVNGNQLDLFDFGFNVFGVTVPAAGVLDFFEISLDLASDLNAFQLDAFTLAQVTFDTVGLGSSDVSFGDVILGGADGAVIADFTTESASVTVVPAPQTLALIAFGLLGLSQLRSARHRATSKTSDLAV